MNEDTKLQCLRLAIDAKALDILNASKQFYQWVTSEDRPDKINYEKTLKERE